MIAWRDLKCSAGFFATAWVIDLMSVKPSFCAMERLAASMRATSFRPISWISSALMEVEVVSLIWNAYRSAASGSAHSPSSARPCGAYSARTNFAKAL